MIKSFIFENFKSFEEAKFELEQLTILIGTNAAGKTNAIEGIKILSEIATGRDFSIILDGSKNMDSDIRGGSKGCCKFNTTYFTLGCIVDVDLDNDLEYRITIKVSDRIYVEEESLNLLDKENNKHLIFKTKRNTNKDSGDIKVEYNNARRGKNPDFTCIRYAAVLPQIVNKLPQDIENYEESISYIKLVINDLRNMLFLNPIPSEMRDYSRITDSELRPNAGNLSSVLYKICQNEEDKEKILNIIKQLPENDVIGIDFIKTQLNDVMFRIKETYGNRAEHIEAKRLSDGTIRCIAVIASIINQEKGSTVIIEEVDNGIHPSRAKSLIDAISSLAKERNIDVIITTHNSALLNAVSKEDIMGISICYRDEVSGTSKFMPFLDIDKYPSLLVHGGIGDLVISEELLNTIKDKKKENNTDNYSWLEVN